MRSGSRGNAVEASLFDRLKLRLYALILIAIMVGFVILCAAAYRQAFTNTVGVTIRADRSGLQMYPGNRVQLRGVDVGRVGSVALTKDGEGAIVTLKMQPDKMKDIPANVGVQLNQLTAFGAKSVDLTYPEHPAIRTLQAGDQLGGDHVAVEVNTLFDHIQRLLDTASPAKVSAVLGNLAAALQGRGDQIGQTAAELDDYLRKFNTNLPQLQRDLSKTADVTNLYADIAPDLSQILQNTTVTSRTLVGQQAQLDSFLFQVSRVGDKGGTFFGQNGDALVDVVQNALPTTALLKQYSPEFACLLKGIDKADKQMLATQSKVPGITGLVTVQPGDVSYKNPQNLPDISAHLGPKCYGLPNYDGRVVPSDATKNADVSTPANGDNRLRLGDPPLVVQLFGPLAGVPLTSQEKAQLQGGKR
jgi:phospholipid/cholesterol/gamma-HCH transport system substrate-binding protein